MANGRSKVHVGWVGMILVLATMLGAAAPPEAGAQTLEDPTSGEAVERSGLRAFGLNLLVPGLGHRYLDGGEWSGWAGFLTGVDAALWLGLTGTVWHRSHAIDSYRMLARSRAHADLSGKDRPFFLQMAQHRSRDAYVEHLLRTRQWQELSRADRADRFWEWDSETAWQEYRDTRSTADALSRRRSILIAGLITHRLVSGLAALLRARGNDSNSSGPSSSEHGTTFELRPPGPDSTTPRAKITFRW